MSSDDEPRVFRPGGISYLRIPANDPGQSADFYRTVFGWQVDSERDDPSFEDATGHVIGHIVADLTPGDAGVRPYVFVDDVDDTLQCAVTCGAAVDTPPYREGNLSVATFRDPSGNVIGLWQLGAARSLE